VHDVVRAQRAVHLVPEERCKRHRRCSTTAFSKSAALPRQGVPKAFPASFATGPCVVTILWHQESG
jgi:hypothetical protein